MRILKLHENLFKYLKEQLKVRRTFKELLLFLKQAGKKYIQAIIEEYKNLFLIFNKEYRNQRQQYNKVQKLKVDLYRSLKLLKYLDAQMAQLGKTRQERRAFWREFFKDGQVRTDVFNQLVSQMEKF